MTRYEGFARVHDELYEEYAKNFNKYDVMASESELNTQLNQTISKLINDYMTDGNFEAAKLKELAILCITKLAHNEFYDVTKLVKTFDDSASDSITVPTYEDSVTISANDRSEIC